jgi:hypothetical protein
MKKIAGLLVTIISAASFSAVAADTNTNATHDVKAPIQLSDTEMQQVVAGRSYPAGGSAISGDLTLDLTSMVNSNAYDTSPPARGTYRE